MSTALYTDRYELTMLTAALASGSAHRRTTFEVFARRLPPGRRYGVVAGTARLLEAIADYRFDTASLGWLLDAAVISQQAAAYLADYRFGGDICGYLEGEPYFPDSPILAVTGTFAEAVVLETLVLSVLNHDCAIAAGTARMVLAAQGRPLIEMGSRRTHEAAAVAGARAAYLTGFASTSNLAACAHYGIPTAGTAAHAFMLLHDSERAAFAAQVAATGTGTTLLVDTYDIPRGIAAAIDVAGPGLGAIRIDSGDLAVVAHQAREQLDSLGALATKIVISGDLDEFAIASLAAAPVDAYGVGTSVVTGTGAPTAGLVYKLVEVDGRPVAKRSANKAGRGGLKAAWRRYSDTGRAVSDHVVVAGAGAPEESDRLLTVELIAGGRPLPMPTLAESRQHHRDAMDALPSQALALSTGESGLPVVLG